MGCGSSSSVVPAQESANGHAKMTANGNGHHGNGNHGNHQSDGDDLSTLVLADSPVKPKPPIAFEIPLEHFDSSRRMSSTPPPHLQRLLQPQPLEISLPHIEEKLAEAETRRQQILQQRAASAQKRTQKMMRSFQEMGRVDSQEPSSLETEVKHVSNAVRLPPGPGVCEDKNI